jgi:hypothetical protein
MTRRSLLAQVAALVTLAAPSAVAQLPDLSGTWVLDLEKSDFGGMPSGPRKDLITHTGPSLRIHRTLSGPNGEEVSATLTFAIDGQAHRNTIGGNDITSRLRWDGAVLVIEGVATGAQEFQVFDRYALGPDRKALTVSRRLVVGDQEMTQSLVFAKQ